MTATAEIIPPVPGSEHVHMSAAETAKMCLVEKQVRDELSRKTYGQINRKLNEVEGWGRKGLLPKFEQAMLWDRIPLPWKIQRYRLGGICYYCGHDTSPDFPGPIMRTNHRGKEVKQSECGYCQMCGEDQYVKQIVQDEEYNRWKKKMRVQKQSWSIRVFKALWAAIPFLNLIKLKFLEGTRVETTEGLFTSGRVYKDSERWTTDDMTDDNLLELQAFYLNQAWMIGQHLQNARRSQ